MKKRLLSLLLILSMVLSCISVTSYAVDEDRLAVLSINSVNKDTATIGANVDSAKAGEVISVVIGAKAGDVGLKVSGYQFSLNYDPNIFELWSQTDNENGSFFENSFSIEQAKKSIQNWGAPKLGNTNGEVNLAALNVKTTEDYTKLNYSVKSNESCEFVRIAFKVKEDVETASTKFEFNTNDSKLIYYADAGNSSTSYAVVGFEGAGISIIGVTPKLSTVKLDNKDTATVTVDGTNGATVKATAASVQSTNLTSMVNWTVAPANSGVSIDNAGVITVAKNAKAGEYTITATGDDTTATGSANATLKVERAPETYTVTVTPKSMEMTVPASDENKGSFSATVTNQYDETMTGGVAWSINSTDDNVSINPTTGEVTVKAEAKNTIEGTTGTEFTVTATYGENTDSATMTVKREESRVSSIELAENAKTTFEVPTVDKTDHEVPEGVNFPAVTVKDQYGEKVSAAEVTWTLGSDKPDGVSVDANDKLVISSSVAANDGFADNKLEFTAIASYGGVSKEVTLTLTRELSTATSVEISGGKSEFTIPVDETADKATFTAVVKDQYGQPVTGDNATVTWSITPSVTGVNFDNGAVSVTKDAKSGTTSSQEFTVTAKCGNAEDTETFTVERAESVVTAIEYTGNTNVVVPDGNSTNECAITLTFKDQYGTEMTSGVDSNNLEWICPKGIMVETGSGTYNVKVSKDALKHFGNERKNSVEVKITAKYGDLTKEIPVTLNLADAVVTTVQLNGDNSIMIPKTVGSVNTKTYTVTVFDQYNFELPDKAKNATYTFTAADANVTCTGYGSDNESKAGAAEVKVSYGATAKSYTLVATVESKDSTAKTIEVKDKTEDTKTLKVVQNNVVFGSKIEPTVTGKPQDSTDLVYSYEGVDGTTYASSTVAPTNVGKYKVTVTCETADTFYTKTINFEITAKSIAGMTVTLDHDSLTYNGQDQSVTAELAGLTSSDYTVSGETTGQNAGTYTVTVTGKGNYTGTVTKTWIITPAELTIESVALENRTYNGEKAVTVKSVTFNGLQNSEKLTIDTDYTATGAMTDANAGENKDVTVTVTLKDTVKNYTLKNRVFESGKVTIAKASHEKVAANMEAKYGNTATLNLATLNLPAGCSFGKISTTDADSIFDGTPSIANSTLSAKLANGAAKAGKKATITIPVSSTNYADYTIEVTVTVLAKTAQTLKADVISVKYGDSFTPTVKDAKTDVTYEVKEGSESLLKIKDGKFVATGVGTAHIVASAAETSEYAPASLDITVTIAKRPLTVKAADKSAYIGEKLPELTYEVTGLVGSDKLTKEPTLEVKHEADVDPMKKVGEYEIGFKFAPAASANYELTTATGKLTVSVRPVYVGPTGSPVEVGRSDNGTVTVSPANPTRGSTVTITVTPNKGQELKSLEVIDQNGNSLPLTDLGNGKFSFVMPEGKVTIKSEFGEANAFVNPYDDVKPGDWYYSAVEYVTVNGLMNGTGNGFEPNLATSRAMIWTILARMSDVNTASGGEWYAVAQQWAIANGVSDGTMPNGTITREQLAAMLYRYAVSKGMVKGPATADLSVFADANSVSSYAVEAMQWAVSTGLIGGMDGKLNPQGSATRAQVATMLMRFAELAK